MKKIHIFGLMTLAAVATTSCEAEKDPVLVTPSSFTLETPAYANQLITLEPGETLEFQCADPAYNLTVAPSYQVEVSLSSDFGESQDPDPDADPASVILTPTESHSTTVQISQSALAQAILDMRGIVDIDGYTDEGPRPVFVRIIAQISQAAATRVYSNSIVLAMVQDFFPAPEEKFLWTPGNSNGWNHANAQKLISTEKDIYEGFMYIDGEYKFTDTDGWDGTNYGIGAGAGTLSPTGGNLPLPEQGAGLYYATVNTAKLTYKLTLIATVNIPGGFNDWNVNTTMSTTDHLHYTYSGSGIGGQEFKFAFNSGWDMNLGGAVDNLQFNGSNLVAPGGATKVTLDLSTYPYSATFE